MTQKLTQLIQAFCSTSSAVSPVKTKIGLRSRASKKAWRTRKRQLKAREMAPQADVTAGYAATRPQAEAGKMGEAKAA